MPGWHEGYAHQLNGDYARAAAVYQAIISTKPDSTDAEEARFRLGEIRFLEEDYAQAISSLRDYLDRYPDGAHRPEAAFLRGAARSALGHWEQAIAAYQSYLAERDIIADYVEMRIAEAYRQLGRPADAMAAYRSALAHEGRPATVALDAMQNIGDALAEMGDQAEAAVWYEKAGAEAAEEGRRAELLLAAGMAYRKAGEEAKAVVALRQLLDQYPRSPAAYHGVAELLDMGQAAGLYQRGVIYYHGRDFDAAAAALGQLIITDPDHPAGAHYYAGLAYRRLGDHRRAIQQFDWLIETHPPGEFTGRAWLEKARSQSEMGLSEEAARTYRRFVAQHPADPLADDALWELAQFLTRRDGEEAAVQVYLDLQADYPDSTRAPEALFRAGLIRYKAGDDEGARQAWQRLAEGYEQTSVRSRALLWLGIAVTRAGEGDEAAEYLAQAHTADPWGYYGLRAGELAGQAVQALPESSSEPVEHWIEAWANPSGSEGLSVGEEAIRSDIHFQRGEELLRIGLAGEAAHEFEAVRSQLSDDPLALYRLALLLAERRLYRPSMRIAWQIAWASPERTMAAAPAYLQRLAYPLYFEDLVTDWASALDMDPLLLFALIRQESWYDPLATSKADARGLTQVMPATGEWIAWRLGRGDFDVDDLYRPVVSVEFGAWYLAQQLENFEGDVFQALAAYNGGPGNARRWAQQADDPDLFVETIDLSETRSYVLRVYEHYRRYKALYGGRPGQRMNSG